MNLHFDHHTLSNGLRLITAPMKETKAVTILILVGAGSRYENARTNGVAHFLEHMFFKGTTKRPSTLEISKELDTMGADYNAFTGEELTGFYVRVAGDDFLKAFDIITDMLLDPLFQAQEIEREKGVIVEELNMYEDTPMRAIGDHAKRLFYGNTSLGRNIGGDKGTVTKLTRNDFVAFRQQFYQPDNLVVAIAGAGQEKDWQASVRERLGGLKGRAVQDYPAAKTYQAGPRLKLVTKQTDQAHLILGFPSFARTDPRRPILKVLRTILGGTMSSRLFIEVRERRGLAYYVRAGMWDFRDAGALVASAGVQVPKIYEAIQVMLAEFHRLVKAPVTEEELDRAKRHLRGSLYLGLEDSMAIADYLANQVLFWEGIEQPEALIAKIEGVTRQELQSLASELLQPAGLHLALIGPYRDQQQFHQLLNQFPGT